MIAVHLTPTGSRYVRLSDIPEPQRSDFKRYLLGAALPVVDGEEGDIAFETDWLDWFFKRRRDRL